jgi:hypothetical protein
MAWGERAAEQHEKDQPNSCLRPDGSKPELEPLQDRRDFELRVRQLLGEIGFNLVLADADHPTTRAAGEKWLARFRAELDQLTLMRSAQILDEAEQRRREVTRKLGARSMTAPISQQAPISQRLINAAADKESAEIRAYALGHAHSAQRGIPEGRDWQCARRWYLDGDRYELPAEIVLDADERRGD